MLGRIGAGLPAAVQFVTRRRSTCSRRTESTVVIAIIIVSDVTNVRCLRFDENATTKKYKYIEINQVQCGTRPQLPCKTAALSMPRCNYFKLSNTNDDTENHPPVLNTV